MIREDSGIEIFAAERNVLRFLEIEPVPIADLHLQLLTEQHSRLVAVTVHAEKSVPYRMYHGH